MKLDLGKEHYHGTILGDSIGCSRHRHWYRVSRYAATETTIEVVLAPSLFQRSSLSEIPNALALGVLRHVRTVRVLITHVELVCR